MGIGRIGRRRAAVVAAASTAVVVAGLLVPASANAYAAVPMVSRLSSKTGPLTGGERITIYGADLRHAVRVNFGSSAGRSLHVMSSYRVSVVVPRHAAGTRNVRVEIRTGRRKVWTAVSSRDRFAWVAPPSVSSVSPATGKVSGGQTITVRGSHFVAGSTVRIAGRAAKGVAVWSSTRLTATVPAGRAGAADVVVYDRYGHSAVTRADRFTWVAPPVIRSVSPAAGPDTGGTTVTITGANLSGVTTAVFGEATATALTHHGDSELTVRTTAGNPGTAVRGTRSCPNGRVNRSRR